MDVAETIAHHILDHDFGVMVGTIHLPFTVHTVTMFCISVALFVAAYLMTLKGKSVFARQMNTLGE